MSDFRIKNGVLVKYTGNGGDVVIPDSVTSIGDRVFDDCRSLTSITIPDSVTSIGDYAFFYCDSLTSITIPDSVTSIGESAFELCGSLTSITISNNLTFIRNATFRMCDLTSIIIPDSVISIGDKAFMQCNLTSVTISDSVTSIGDEAFEDNFNLKNITIPDSVTSIGDDAFVGCVGLASITIPDSVTFSRGSAFWGCIGLANQKGMVIIRNVLCYYGKNEMNAEIPDTVTSIGNHAFQCLYEDRGNLTSITIPDSVTFIGDGAFETCSNLTSVTILNPDTYISETAFEECENLKEFICPPSFAKELQTILPQTQTPITLHFPNISNISAEFRPGAAVGFVEDNRDCTDENGKAYVKYIKANAAKLVGLAIEHPALFYLMLREKLISAKDLDAFTAAVQDSGNTELIAAILDYANSGVSEEDKAKVQQKKETLDTNVTNFLFDAEQIEQISGKTFAVTGKLKTFASRDELKACLDACGATLTEKLSYDVNYLITNTPDSGTEKNRKAEKLGISRITEAQFNKMVGRKVQK